MSTPITDSAEFNGRDMGADSASPHFKCVDAEFVRQLELAANAMEEALKPFNALLDDDEPASESSNGSIETFIPIAYFAHARAALAQYRRLKP